jgi:hypothetical protein
MKKIPLMEDMDFFEKEFTTPTIDSYVKDVLKIYHTAYVVDIHGKVNVKDQNVEIYSVPGNRIPVRFGVVGLNFICKDIALNTLANSPEKVGGDFDCSKNNLTSIKDAPNKVGGYFNCSDNPITDLKGIPRIVKSYNLSDTKITHLSHIMRKTDVFDISYCNELKSLEGSPAVCTTYDIDWYFGESLEGMSREITEFIGISDVNRIVNLKGIAQITEKTAAWITNCRGLESLEGMPNIWNGTLHITRNQALENILEFLPKKINGDLHLFKNREVLTEEQIREKIEVSGTVNVEG